jgi:hypothetical protein
MMPYTFWTPVWAEAVRICINRGPAPEERARIRRPDTYWEVVDKGRQTFSGSVVIGIRDLAPGEPCYLSLVFDQGVCAAARLAAAPEGAEPRYVLDGRRDDWHAVVGHGDLMRSIMYGTVRLETGDPLRFFRDIAFFVEVVRCLAKVPTTLPGSAAA